jgi:hypothetical protein
MLHRVAHIRTGVTEQLIASIIRVTRIGELGMLAVTSNWSTLQRNTVIESCLPDDGGDTFLQNVGSHKSHTA